MEPLADIVYAACANPTKLLLSHPTPEGRRKVAEGVKASLRDCRRFYVDDEVVRAASYLGVQHPDVLMSMLPRARLPFAKCWVEWDPTPQLEETGYLPAEDIPPRTGCIIERLDDERPLFRLTSIGLVTHGLDAIEERRRGKACSVSPLSIIYSLDQPVSNLPISADRRTISEISKLPEDYVQRTVIGAAYMEHESEKREPDEIAHRRVICDNLATYAANVFTPFMAPIIRETLSDSRRYDRAALESIIRSQVFEHSGTWRFIIALFGLINARDYVESEKVIRQGKSRTVNAKTIPYLDHWLVALKLPRKIVQQRLLREFAEAMPRRRHEVTGHWKQSRKKGLPDCEHVYVDETPSRQVCVFEGCGHKRWWVNEFERGDASVGYVIKDRLVTKD